MTRNVTVKAKGDGLTARYDGVLTPMNEEFTQIGNDVIFNEDILIIREVSNANYI